MKLTLKMTTTLLAGVTMVGCNAIAPDSRIDEVKKLAPHRWLASKESRAGIDHDWVARFKDRELSLLVDIALASTPNMRIARERVIQARQDVAISGAALKPTASFAADIGRSENRFDFGSGSIGYESSSGTTNLQVNWEPDVWGGKRAASSAVIGEYQAQEAELRGAKALLAAQVCKAWFSLAEAREQESLAREALSIRKETADAVQLRFEENLATEGGSASQLRLAQTDIATAKASLSARAGEVEAARRQLEILLGRYPAAKLKGRSKMPAIGSSPPIGLPSQLLLRRPDIIAAERRYAAAGKKVEEGKYAIYPSFPLTASVGTSSSQLRRILSSDFGVWSIAAGIVTPVLTGGQVKAEQLKRDSIQRQSLASLQDIVIAAFGEVESALASEKWIVRRINDFNEAHTLAKEAAEAANDDYANGTGDVLTLFNARNRQIDIASQIAILRRLRAHTRIDLHLALGGGFKVTSTK